MAYDDDRVQCHLCGKWFKWVGGAHLRQGHGWSLDEYREAFQLLRTTTTASPATSTLKRKRMFDQIAAGQRVPPDHEEAKRRRAKQDPTVARWRSLAAMRPDLAAELHPTRNGKLDPLARCRLRPRVADVAQREDQCRPRMPYLRQRAIDRRHH
jgi:hypothetical protein